MPGQLTTVSKILVLISSSAENAATRLPSSGFAAIVTAWKPCQEKSHPMNALDLTSCTVFEVCASFCRINRLRPKLDCRWRKLLDDASSFSELKETLSSTLKHELHKNSSHRAPLSRQRDRKWLMRLASYQFDDDAENQSFSCDAPFPCLNRGLPEGERSGAPAQQ